MSHLRGEDGGAAHLLRIHGTEEDKVNCPFYFKIGACRHGDRCSRQHNKPPFSQTLVIFHIYQNPLSLVALTGGDASKVNHKQLQDEFDDFFEEVYVELKKYGTIEEIQVCENLGEHMLGNAYVKYADEEDCERALTNLYGRYYDARPLVCEYSPVTDFREARCRQYDDGTCTRGGYCNFLHIKEPSVELCDHLRQEHDYGKYVTSRRKGRDNDRRRR